MLDLIMEAIKLYIFMSLLRSPWLLPGIAAAVTAFLLYCGAFVKFKNGWFSVLLYLLLLGTSGGYLAVSTYVLNHPPEDLKLSRPRAVKIGKFASEGAVTVDWRGRPNGTLPLLGIMFPSDTSLELANKYLQNDLKYERIYYSSSKVYTGGVLTTGSGINLNEYFLDEGYASTDELHPASYKYRRQAAQLKRVGIWKYASDDYKNAETTYRSNNFVIFVTLLLTLITPVWWITDEIYCKFQRS